jgi:LPXTG-motif cell wall-anchored protein
MGRRITTTLMVLVALLATLLSVPTAAQTPEEECLVALQAQVQPFTAAQLEALGEFFDDVPPGASLEAFLRELLGDPTLSLADLDPNVCTIYIANVFADDGEFDDDGAPDDDGIGVDDAQVDDDGVVADDGERVPPPPTQRRGLPVTGFDVLWLTGLGAAIIGLGYVALRRSRDQAS